MDSTHIDRIRDWEKRRVNSTYKEEEEEVIGKRDGWVGAGIIRKKVR